MGLLDSLNLWRFGCCFDCGTQVSWLVSFLQVGVS